MEKERAKERKIYKKREKKRGDGGRRERLVLYLFQSAANSSFSLSSRSIFLLSHFSLLFLSFSYSIAMAAVMRMARLGRVTAVAVARRSLSTSLARPGNLQFFVIYPSSRFSSLASFSLFSLSASLTLSSPPVSSLHFS